MSLLKTLILSLAVLTFSFIGTVVLQRALAFNNPGSVPPASNVPLPLNTSPTTQTKLGPLGATKFQDTDNTNYFFKPAGRSKLGGPLDLSGNRIKNVQDPADPQDVATKAYVDQAASAVNIPLAAGGIPYESGFATSWSAYVAYGGGGEGVAGVAAAPDGGFWAQIGAFSSTFNRFYSYTTSYECKLRRYDGNFNKIVDKTLTEFKYCGSGSLSGNPPFFPVSDDQGNVYLLGAKKPGSSGVPSGVKIYKYSPTGAFIKDLGSVSGYLLTFSVNQNIKKFDVKGDGSELYILKVARRCSFWGCSTQGIDGITKRDAQGQDIDEVSFDFLGQPGQPFGLDIDKQTGQGIAFASNGIVYFDFASPSKIIWQKSFSSITKAIIGGPSQDIYALAGGQIMLIDKNTGNLKRTFNLPFTPRDFAVDKKGDIVISRDAGVLARVNADGQVVWNRQGKLPGRIYSYLRGVIARNDKIISWGGSASYSNLGRANGGWDRVYFHLP